MNEKLKAKIENAPKKPGIYAFRSKTGKFLYIGKAGNIKNRVKQYLRPDFYSPFLKNLLDEAQKIDFKTTATEIEALILESKLIKEKQPKYNIMLRDDKQYFYVVFTNDEFSKIFITHNPVAIKRGVTRLGVSQPRGMFHEHGGGEEGQDPEARGYIGPFTDGVALKTTLRLLRRIFPYCTCKQRHNNFCLNYHIGKCLGYCCLKQPELNIKYKVLSIYKKNIRAIKDILLGEKDSLIKKLRKELRALGKNQEFEKAIELRNKIEKLEKVFENAKIIQDYKYEAGGKESDLEKLAAVFKLPQIPRRIEGYDISNIQGKNAVGAMVVFTDGQPDKDEYRKFKIIFKKTSDDTAMLKEVLLRRFNHPEWTQPDLIFIDGGKGQLNAAENAIADSAALYKTATNIVIISLAKGRNEVFSTTLKKPMAMKRLPPALRNLVLHIDSEAHRFAVNYYRRIHRRTALR